ncbi:leucine-rich repeat, cysteine-containing subtype protein [Tanacetum coccineum]
MTLCFCGLPAVTRPSWTDANPGRRFLGCPQIEGQRCIYFGWLDPIQRISLTGFPAQSVGSSNIDVLDSPCLLVLITGTSQSRQHVISDIDVLGAGMLDWIARDAMAAFESQYIEADISLREIGSKCLEMRMLRLKGYERITNVGLRAFFCHQNLEILSLVSCYKLSWEDVKPIVMSCLNLGRLYLSRSMKKRKTQTRHEDFNTQRCKIYWE